MLRLTGHRGAAAGLSRGIQVGVQFLDEQCGFGLDSAVGKMEHGKQQGDQLPAFGHDFEQFQSP